jgi:hypothetical protein
MESETKRGRAKDEKLWQSKRWRERGRQMQRKVKVKV